MALALSFSPALFRAIRRKCCPKLPLDLPQVSAWDWVRVDRNNKHPIVLVVSVVAAALGRNSIFVVTVSIQTIGMIIIRKVGSFVGVEPFLKGPEPIIVAFGVAAGHTGFLGQPQDSFRRVQRNVAENPPPAAAVGVMAVGKQGKDVGPRGS